MNKVKKIITVLVLAIILTIASLNQVFAEPPNGNGSHWYDYNDNDWFMSQDINDLASELCGKSLSFYGEGSVSSFPPNVGCMDPNTGLGGGRADFMGAGIIDITRKYW